jgi:hypothetical protein
MLSALGAKTDLFAFCFFALAAKTHFFHTLRFSRQNAARLMNGWFDGPHRSMLIGWPRSAKGGGLNWSTQHFNL